MELSYLCMQLQNLSNAPLLCSISCFKHTDIATKEESVLDEIGKGPKCALYNKYIAAEPFVKHQWGEELCLKQYKEIWKKYLLKR